MRLPRPHPGLVVAGLLLAGGTIWLLDGGHRLFRPKRLGVVDEGHIWRAGQIHRRLLTDVVREHGIDLVLDLARDTPGQPDEAAEGPLLERLGVERWTADDLEGDGTGNLGSYVTALQRLVDARDAGRRVLVHCAGGSERTGALVAWYRMLFEGWDGPRAWDEYLAYRSRPPRDDVHPAYVNSHTADLVRRLEAAGVVVPHPSAGRFGPAETAR
jgi:hypothetical protein